MIQIYRKVTKANGKVTHSEPMVVPNSTKPEDLFAAVKDHQEMIHEKFVLFWVGSVAMFVLNVNGYEVAYRVEQS